jgi:3-hydroxyisobutyrate dehydrogenase-like beta-hydroxyacid dehydrogenase/hemerythrin-like domain-containing protein
MTTTAFLGTGLLGSAFVEAMLARGESVRVWNRTRSRAEPLAALGASVHDTPAEAVHGAGRVPLCLSDDAAVDGVLDAASGSLAPGVWVIDHTTTSPQGARRRDERAGREGFQFAHAPVFMSPAMARAAKGIMLLSGPDASRRALEPLLAPMTGELVHLGARVDLAASFKLFGNALLVAITGGLADVFAMARALSIEPEHALSLFAKFNPAGAIQGRGERMARGDFAASFELTMARKDVGLMIEAASDQPLAVLPAIAARMDALIAAGHAKSDLGALGALDASRRGAGAGIGYDAARERREEGEPQRASARVIGRLRTTHRRIEERLADLEASAARGAAQGVDDVIAFYERAIVTHEDDEEQTLFPRLSSVAEATPIVRTLAAEHRAQKELWDRLIHATREAQTEVIAIAGDIRASYARHLAVEERDLFPLIEARIPEDEWARMDAEMTERRGARGGGGGGGSRGRRG